MASTEIPKVQMAAVKVGKGEASKAPAKEVEVQTPEAHQILVKLNWFVASPRTSSITFLAG